ncbi:glycosyltransferase family 2 protein [Desulfobulbus rhabdoformis]|uniref:glycosyltransferase family 2 protein n=1 Tax=Desulfobulbus rhabdoformis TaxID=34032 RepID=UPI0019645057|nr:glycosyltransferase family 2 protein [Desulfobulbus rhabdoformis]MBM9616720.1 glycosyltransferase family 2 protein [Desulfobulbus rhabdoformis]
MPIQIILIFSLISIFYIYFGYPILIHALSLIKEKYINKKNIQPTVTIIIAAYNEAESIKETVTNKLKLNYPHDKIEIIVVSDESTDETDNIVTAYCDSRIRLIRQTPRAGKTSALNLAVPFAQGEIIVFSDANSHYDSQALRHLVANFADPEVGYVTGKMIYTNSDGTMVGDGCSAYMKYENFLRQAESKTGSIVGVDGGIDAMRKDLYQRMNPDQLPDFVQPLMVVTRGYRVVYEPKALLKEASLKSSHDEYRMRVRVALRAFWAISDMKHLLSFSLNPLFSWQLWSHKLLRYLCFIFLLSAFCSNIILLGCGWSYTFLFVLQCSFYGAALITSTLESSGKTSVLLGFIRYFTLLNLACAQAFVKFLRRQKQVTWTPRKG